MSNFNPEHPTIILSHGWNSNGREEVRGFGSDFAENYLQVGDYNVFSVDWGDLESWTNYPHAAAITRPVGEYAACLGSVIYFNYIIKRFLIKALHMFCARYSFTLQCNGKCMILSVSFL